jgi:hypothetical protein
VLACLFAKLDVFLGKFWRFVCSWVHLWRDGSLVVFYMSNSSVGLEFEVWCWRSSFGVRF